METPKEPWNFCETPEEKCTMNYCDENGCMNRKRAFVSEIEKLETLYRKVAVSERLPQSSGYYWIENVVGEMKSAWYLPKEMKFGVSSLGKKEIVKYWLEPIESENSPQLEKLEADKAELLGVLELAKQSVSNSVRDEIESLIQKHKQ